jgi:diacylglycerol O-acyltransferase
MSSVDRAWLRMDSEGNLMMIVGVVILDGSVTVAQLTAALRNRILVYARFRSRVVRDGSGLWWQEQEINLEDHVVHMLLQPGETPSHSNKASLQHLVGRLASQRLNRDKPLWQLHLVDNYVGADGVQRQALIVRIHHCIADGVALVTVFMSMFSAQRDMHAPSRPPASRSEGEQDNPWAQLLHPVTHTGIKADSAHKAVNASTSTPGDGFGVLSEVGHLADEALDLGHHAVQLAQDLFGITTMSDDSASRLKGQPNGVKHVAWSEPMPLDEIKAIGKFYGCTINDVLMSCVAGSLRAYLIGKGDGVAPECEMRAMVPVNLRQQGGKQKLGNLFGLVPLVLPVGIEDPVARLREVQRRMAALKGSYTALVAMSMLGILGATPKEIQHGIQNYFSRRTTMVMSNVPGPRAPLYLAGAKLEQIMFWVPQSGDVGMGVSILSYNGGVQFGIETDDALADDPQAIIDRFAPEFEKLVLLALLD